MYQILSIMQLILCIIILLYEYNNKSISVFFWVVLLVLFCVPHALEIFVNNPEYPRQVLNQASLFVLGFQYIYLITRKLILNKNEKPVINDYAVFKSQIKKNPNNNNYKKILFFCGLCLLIFILYFLLRFGKIFNIAWGDIYKANSNAEGFFEQTLEFIKYFNNLLFFAVTGLLVITICMKKKIPSLLIIGLVLYYSLVTKNRITFLPLLVSIITIMIMKNYKLGLKQIVTFAGIGILSVYFIYAVWVFRHAGTLTMFFKKYNFITFNQEILNSILTGTGELSLRKIFYHFISINNDFPGLGTGATYLRILLMFVPAKYSFGLKPSDFAITMSSAYTGDITNTIYSVHPTFFGDLFANFHFWGIIFGAVWAIFFLGLDRIVKKQDYVIKNCLIVLWGSCFVILARGSVYNSIFIGICSTIILFIIKKMKVFKYNKR